MSHKIEKFVIFVIFSFNIVISVFGNFEFNFEPTLTVIDNEGQNISLKCSITSNDISLENRTIEFAIQYEDHYYLRAPDFRDPFYSYIELNYSYNELKSELNISNDSFEIKCWASVDSNKFGNTSVEIIYPKGFNESCSEQIPCNKKANLICNNSRCLCDSQYIAIEMNSTGGYNCHPKVGYNESCIDDRQCRAVDPNTDCGVFDAISKRCQCSKYHAFDGIKCYSDWSDWLCFQWSLHPMDIIIILMLFSIGFSILLIVISISLYLKSKNRRAIMESNTFRYPSSLTPKIMISKYFHESEDEKHLKSFDYLSKQ